MLQARSMTTSQCASSLYIGSCTSTNGKYPYCRTKLAGSSTRCPSASTITLHGGGLLLLLILLLLICSDDSHPAGRFPGLRLLLVLLLCTASGDPATKRDSCRVRALPGLRPGPGERAAACAGLLLLPSFEPPAR